MSAGVNPMSDPTLGVDDTLVETFDTPLSPASPTFRRARKNPARASRKR